MKQTHEPFALGFLTLRFWNNDVDSNLDGVVETIIARAHESIGAQTLGVRHG